MLVGDEITIFLPVILLFILILLSPLFSRRISPKYFKLVSFSIYIYIFLQYMFIFCYHVSSTNINYFLYKTFYISNLFNFNVSFGIDNFTIFFLLLTSLLFPFCILINWEYRFIDFRKFIVLISILDISLICAFMSTNLFFFLFFFWNYFNTYVFYNKLVGISYTESSRRFLFFHVYGFWVYIFVTRYSFTLFYV